ncbi:MAG: hypothetical protein A2010_12050 [Nitrospirae bacterium GWD2_57_9]|nr:MAG: hypothetical protein A2010_12050 [Nitrospirae bacterium GWD2_57_9]
MKNCIVFLLITVCLYLTFPTVIGAAEARTDRKAWTTQDTIVEAVFVSLVYVDWKQTIEFTQHPDKYPDCFETNPLLGPHPSRTRVNTVVAGSVLAHAFIAQELSQPYRAWWQFFWIGVEIHCIRKNRVVMGVTTSF